MSNFYEFILGAIMICLILLGDYQKATLAGVILTLLMLNHNKRINQ